MKTSVCVLAGGLATRLQPVSLTIPKSLIKINGKFFLDFQLEKFSSEGVKYLVYCLGYLAEPIIEHLKTIDFLGSLKLVVDPPKTHGTLTAIKQALPLLSDPFLVMYGDSYLETDFKTTENLLRETFGIAAITYQKNTRPECKNNVRPLMDGSVIYRNNSHANTSENHMEYVEYGLTMLSKSVFERHVTKEMSDLSDLLESLSNKGELRGVEVHEDFFEIGSFEGIERFSKHLKENKL